MWRRVAVGSTGLVLSAYAYDTFFCYERFNRNARSVIAALQTAYDYKVEFPKAMTPAEESDIHRRVANRCYDVCCENGGLYVKLGQTITTMAHVMPPEYYEIFKNLHDQAPQADPEAVRNVIREELGDEPDSIFSHFEPTAVASASIAQVHRATLRDGTPVAIKVQKPWISWQMPWDLACYRLLVYALDWYFEMPMYWTTDSVCRAITDEADFRVEARYSERAAKNWATSAFSQDVHVPKVHWPYTSRKVMCQEWCEGVKINETAKLEALGFDRTKVANTMVNIFADQIFRTGLVHGDPVSVLFILCHIVHHH